MATKKKLSPTEQEIARLNAVYVGLSENQKAVVEGLIVQAARLRVLLDNLQKEIDAEGLTSWFSQSENQQPYKRTNPCADLFAKYDKSYQAIIKQLNELTPPDKKKSALSEFEDEDDTE